jgi:hypothetical protein
MSEQQIFEVARALPVKVRPAYLDAVCEGLPEVRAGIEQLLASLEADAFMQPAGGPTMLDADANLARIKPEQVGERIGPYKLLEQIGEGGFGTGLGGRAGAADPAACGLEDHQARAWTRRKSSPVSSRSVRRSR